MQKNLVEMSKYLIEENNSDNQYGADAKSKLDIPSIVLTAVIIIMCFVIPFSISPREVDDDWYNCANGSVVENVYNVIEESPGSQIQDTRKLPLDTASKLEFTVDRQRSNDVSDVSNFIVIRYGYADIDVRTSDGDVLYNSYDERYSSYINEGEILDHTRVARIDNLARKDNFEIINIPGEYKGRYIEITLDPIKNSDIALVNNIYRVNNLAELVALILAKEIHLIIPAAIMVVIGLAGLMLYIIYRLFIKEYVNILYLTQLAGFTGVILLCQTDFIKAILPDRVDTFYYVLFISSQLLNLPILKYITTRFGDVIDHKDADFKNSKLGKRNKLIFMAGRGLMILTIVNSVIQLILSLSGYIAYVDTILISVSLSVLTSFVFVAICFVNRDKLGSFEKYFYIAIYVMNSLSMVNSTYLKFHIFGYVLAAETVLFIIFLITVALKYFENVGKERIRFSLLDEALRTDNLTKLGSRYAYEHKLDELNRSDKECVIIFVDLNNLKFINDELGHVYGDKAIKGVAEYLKTNFAGSDIFRIGGDEYVIIYQNAFDYKKLSKLETEEVYVQGVSEHMPVAMSFGVAYYNPDNSENETIEDYVKYADRAMYINKQKYKKKNPQWSYRVLG